MAIVSPGVVRGEIEDHIDSVMAATFDSIVFHDGDPNIVIEQGFVKRAETVLQVRMLAGDGASYSGRHTAMMRVDTFELNVIGSMQTDDSETTILERYNARKVALDLVAHTLWTNMQDTVFADRSSRIGSIQPLDDILANYAAYTISVEINQY